MPRGSLSQDVIVEAAQKLIRDSGSTDWTVRSLCKVLECAPGALYRHFPDGVAQITTEIRGRAFARLSATLDAAEGDPQTEGLPSLMPTTCAARLARRCRAYLRFAEVHPAVYQNLYGPLRAGLAPTYAKAAAEMMLTRHAGLIQAAADARELTRPRIGHEEAMMLALMLWLQLHGFADLTVSGVTGKSLYGLEDRLIISILALAGFYVATYPAGLEAAAKAARQRKAQEVEST